MSNRTLEESFMVKHVKEEHDGNEGQFRAKVTHSNKDCLSCQVREGVLIRRNTTMEFSDKRRAKDINWRLNWIKLCESNKGFNSQDCGLRHASIIQNQYYIGHF